MARQIIKKQIEEDEIQQKKSGKTSGPKVVCLRGVRRETNRFAGRIAWSEERCQRQEDIRFVCALASSDASLTCRYVSLQLLRQRCCGAAEGERKSGSSFPSSSLTVF
eukprot:766697-Hanusia_phi.AAC.5